MSIFSLIVLLVIGIGGFGLIFYVGLHEWRWQKWEISHTPFSEWDMDHVYVCFNDLCPYMQEGWEVMRSQGAAGFTYRLMYDPDHNVFQPTPLPSAQALKQYKITPRG